MSVLVTVSVNTRYVVACGCLKKQPVTAYRRAKLEVIFGHLPGKVRERELQCFL
jgi:hypothetical protein